MAMEVIPAVDLSGGRVVRLLQGDYGRVTGFDETPDEAADRFALAGAGWLHVIDLDAARDGDAQPGARRGARAPGRPARDAPPGRRRLPLGRAGRGGARRRRPARAHRHARGARSRRRRGARGRARRAHLRVRRRARRHACAWRAGARTPASRRARSSSASRRAAWARSWSRRSSATARSPGPDLQLLAGVRAVTDGVLLAAGGFAALEHIAAARDAGCDGAVVGRALYDGSLNLREALTVARAPSQKPGPVEPPCRASRVEWRNRPAGRWPPRPAEVAGDRCLFPMTIDRVIRRRILLGFLVAASFGLLTAWYREVDNGPLHRAQGSVADAAVPLSAAVQRVSRPFRDSLGLEPRPRQRARRGAAPAGDQPAPGRRARARAAGARRQRPTTARCSTSRRTRASPAC